jgi:hypothetical protein
MSDETEIALIEQAEHEAITMRVTNANRAFSDHIRAQIATIATLRSRRKSAGKRAINRWGRRTPGPYTKLINRLFSPFDRGPTDPTFWGRRTPGRNTATVSNIFEGISNGFGRLGGGVAGVAGVAGTSAYRGGQTLWPTIKRYNEWMQNLSHEETPGATFRPYRRGHDLSNAGALSPGSD